MVNRSEIPRAERPRVHHPQAKQIAHSQDAWPFGLTGGTYEIEAGQKRETVKDGLRLVALSQGSGAMAFRLDRPGDEYTLRWTQPLRFFCLWVEPAWFEAHFKIPHHAAPQLCGIPDAGLLRHCAQLSQATRGNDKVRSLWVETQAVALFHEVFRYMAPRYLREALGRRLNGSQLNRVTESIWSNLGADHDLAELAAIAGTSTSHFAHGFRASTGYSPWQYVMRARLESARNRLPKSLSTIADLAAELGFSDQAHFTRLFKRAYGITPGSLQRGASARLNTH